MTPILLPVEPPPVNRPPRSRRDRWQYRLAVLRELGLAPVVLIWLLGLAAWLVLRVRVRGR